MDSNSSVGRRGLLVFSTLLVVACAGYSGANLKPGVSTLPEVVASMGQPAMSWTNPDGSEQLAYPRGPGGTQTFMAYVGPDGKLQRIEKVLNQEHFARVRPGMSKDEVLRILGPSGSLWTQFYARSNQLAWSWLFCNSWNAEEFFDVMFDASTGIVHSTGQHPNLAGPDGVQPRCGQ
ncbi:MAG: hypothetical protein IAE88_14970 [Rhodobacteraceae bacterium]|uniref:hypothetical protein n=1 Tax=Accumulibacter sp. TaxID=2053492 RepID=UPI0019DA51CA|nr:hypothetical protein [Accumulibacter sp.]MBE2260161.1 hypothetical protein [Paracoccaceae bacterium]